jgi:DNA-binding NarL/FixJ family response regulator
MKRTLSVRLDEEDWDKLASRADEVGLTSSTLARLLIRDSLSGAPSLILTPSDATPPQTPENQEMERTGAVESPLTPREAEILSKIAEGQTNQRIGHTLGVSRETIKKDLASIIRKLSASDRTQAVVLAIRQGHIHPENNAGRG